MCWCVGPVDHSEVYAAYEYKPHLQRFLGNPVANSVLMVPSILPQEEPYESIVNSKFHDYNNIQPRKWCSYLD